MVPGHYFFPGWSMNGRIHPPVHAHELRARSEKIERGVAILAEEIEARTSERLTPTDLKVTDKDTMHISYIFFEGQR